MAQLHKLHSLTRLLLVTREHHHLKQLVARCQYLKLQWMSVVNIAVLASCLVTVTVPVTSWMNVVYVAELAYQLVTVTASVMSMMNAVYAAEQESQQVTATV